MMLRIVWIGIQHQTLSHHTPFFYLFLSCTNSVVSIFIPASPSSCTSPLLLPPYLPLFPLSCPLISPRFLTCSSRFSFFPPLSLFAKPSCLSFLLPPFSSRLLSYSYLSPFLLLFPNLFHPFHHLALSNTILLPPPCPLLSFFFLCLIRFLQSYSIFTLPSIVYSYQSISFIPFHSLFLPIPPPLKTVVHLFFLVFTLLLRLLDSKTHSLFLLVSFASLLRDACLITTVEDEEAEKAEEEGEEEAEEGLRRMGERRGAINKNTYTLRNRKVEQKWYDTLSFSNHRD